MKRIYLLILLLGLWPALGLGQDFTMGQNHSLFEIENYGYSYQEPGVMRLTGAMYGVGYSYKAQTGRRTWSYSLRYFFGLVNYDGATFGGDPLKIDNIPDWGYEMRGFLGYDYLFGKLYLVTPYLGVGYRYLADNSQLRYEGGYQRESNYLYLPLGVEISRPFSRGRIEAMVEYDYFISGTQVSHLSNVTSDFRDSVSIQPKGYGLRGAIGYGQKNNEMDWEAKIFVRIWDIEDSNPDSSSNPGLVFLEPKNNTSEVGLSVGVRY